MNFKKLLNIPRDLVFAGMCLVGAGCGDINKISFDTKEQLMKTQSPVIADDIQNNAFLYETIDSDIIEIKSVVNYNHETDDYFNNNLGLIFKVKKSTCLELGVTVSNYTGLSNDVAFLLVELTNGYEHMSTDGILEESDRINLNGANHYCFGEGEYSLRASSILRKGEIQENEPAFFGGSIYINLSYSFLDHDFNLSGKQVDVSNVNVFDEQKDVLFVNDRGTYFEFLNFYPKTNITTFDNHEVVFKLFNDSDVVEEVEIYVDNNGEQIFDTLQLAPKQTLRYYQDFNGPTEVNIKGVVEVSARFTGDSDTQFAFVNQFNDVTNVYNQ